jgi:transposase
VPPGRCHRREDRCALLLVKAQHVKAVPGRQTDVKDAVPAPGAPLADLVRHGLRKGRFVPDRPQRDLRALPRDRTSLVQERTAAVNRIQQTLAGANIKLATVATDVLGKSGREIRDALVAGTTEAALLADLAKGRLRAKRPALERALAGRVEAHQRVLLAQQLAHLDLRDETVERLGAEIAERVHPFVAALERLDTIPGVGRRTAEILLAAVGPDRHRFPPAAHLAAWAGCPLGAGPGPARERRVPPGRCG